MILIIVDNCINDLGPALQSTTAANEKIFFVKNVENLIFKLFDQ